MCIGVKVNSNCDKHIKRPYHTVKGLNKKSETVEGGEVEEEKMLLDSRTWVQALKLKRQQGRQRHTEVGRKSGMEGCWKC